jgi:putative tryptophan/tyrosine transport system substrate-binding protein
MKRTSLPLQRRKFITLIGGAAAWPLAARAQLRAMPVLGFVSGGSPIPFEYLVRAFRQGLKDTGYVEGENVAIEFRWAEGQYDRLPSLVDDLIRRRVSVVAATTTGALAAKATSNTIPIVFVTDGRSGAAGPPDCCDWATSEQKISFRAQSDSKNPKRCKKLTD